MPSARRRPRCGTPIGHQRDDQVGRQPRHAPRDLVEDAIRAARDACAGDEVGERLQHAQHHVLLAAAPALGRLGDELFGELLEAVWILRRCRAAPHRLVVEVRQLAFEIVIDDAIPVAVEPAAALAQHLGVVDLPELDRAAAGGHPGAHDAALAADVFRRPRDQAEERVPLVGREIAEQPQLADQMRVQQRGQFAERAVRLGRRCGRRADSSSGRTVRVTAPSPRSRCALSATRSSEA